ncbi:uncharacterized protein [Centroberyx affinis]|uniref:uncharacterized protein n=1 Tax=Centroberyx affinis TaxID=166261 RepID=UPI003A5C5B22
MGCSPSKGKLFARLEGPGAPKALLAGAAEDAVDFKPVEEENKCLKTDDREKELPLPTKEEVPRVVEHDIANAQSPEDIKETEVNVMTQEIGSEVMQVDTMKKLEKRKKNKGLEKRRRTGKQRKSSIIQTKVDLPPHMVRAHQAAYAYLNPNISKYETLLGLLDQAAQTQLSLQPMMSAVVLRFDEINQALEEMAEEGELMLKEHGEYMAWPSGMTGPSVMSAKPSSDKTNPLDPPPDLLQQLLQHSTEKMRLVGGSVQGLGDSTLEEAVEYFASLSKLLAGRLQAKQAVEQRLVQVLARVEKAAIKKSNPEDSALHSEDSGIGGENESLTGSERHRRHRGSAGSGSCGSGGNIRAAFDFLPNNLPNQAGLNEGEEEDEEEEEEDDDDEEDGEDEGERPGRKRSNSSPPDPSRPLSHMGANKTQELQSKRPLTAATSAKPDHSPSTGCVNILLELQRSQRDLDKQMRKMVLAPQPPGHNSVRRLINTFSHGVDGRPGQSLANIPPHIRRPRKSGTLILPDIGNGGEGALVINGNNNNNSWSDGREDLDVDNLPPPPPEVLMDNSFQSTEDTPGDEEEVQDASDRGRPVINQRTAVSQRLRASVQNVTVLPNRASVTQKAIGILPARPVRQDAVMGMQPGQDAEPQPDTELDLEKEKNSTLYQQARKIIHLRNAAESPLKRNQAEQEHRPSLESVYHRLVPPCTTDFQALLLSDLSPPLGPRLGQALQGP